ncbi:TlpA disulfide reductase family protein [Gemmatimonas sp.]|uniref:TlpA disulfide reductase family protein n=2 Tax=Gemmatimonas sp. TaxID=1962908 RepID=UPI00262E7876|nr:TlpA disulfide reductase family protein [Gemmatimonas sp.]
MDDDLGMDRVPDRRRRRASLGAVALLTAAALALWVIIRPQPVLEAGMISGRLVLSPASPRAGERVEVRYSAGALFGRTERLRLRGRVRTTAAESYEQGVPVIALGTLERVEGNEYRGQFVLPDSFVFAALAVEDTLATEVDDFGGRAWEVLRAGPDGRPLLDALEQRAHDLMGRSWEEGLATARRMASLYPDSVRAVKWLQTYELWMGIATDSTRAVHLQNAQRFAERDLRRPMSAHELGEHFWYVRTLDTSLALPWRQRLLREAPRSGLAVQEELIDVQRLVATGRIDSAAAVKRLDMLWPRVPRERAGQIGGAALSLLGGRSERAADLRRWIDRLHAADTTEGGRRRLAQELIDHPLTRADGMARLRTLLVQSAPGTSYRRLGESRAANARRLSEERASTLAVLGSALLADGAYAAARDTLQLAVSLTWSPAVWRRLAEAHTALRDSVGAAHAWAHEIVDPRTTATVHDSLNRVGLRLLGASGWATSTSAAERALRTHLDARALRRVVGEAEVTALDGRRAALSDMAKGRGLVVVFWSPLCGPAVEAVPEIESLRRQLARRGVPLVVIAEQSAVTPELTKVMTEQRLEAPVYLDVGGGAAARFNNWGTPTLYLLDTDGRVMFPGTTDVPSALFYSAALLQTAPKSGQGR